MFCAVIVGIKIEPFQNEVEVLQCFTLPPQLSDLFAFAPAFSAAFSTLATPANAVHCATQCMLSLAVCMAKDVSSSMANGPASSGVYSAGL